MIVVLKVQDFGNFEISPMSLIGIQSHALINAQRVLSDLGQLLIPSKISAE